MDCTDTTVERVEARWVQVCGGQCAECAGRGGEPGADLMAERNVVPCACCGGPALGFECSVCEEEVDGDD